MEEPRIQNAIVAGLNFKRLEKHEGGVTASTISAYQVFNSLINGLDESQKEFINSEVRKLNK